MEYTQIKQAVKHTLLFIIRLITLLLRTIYTACLSIFNGVKEIWNDSKETEKKELICSCHGNRYSRGRIVDLPTPRQALVYCSKHFPKNEDSEIVPLDAVGISNETSTEPDAHGQSLGDWPKQEDDIEDLWKKEQAKITDHKKDTIHFGSLIANTMTPLAPLTGEYTIDPSRFTAGLCDAPLTAAIKAN